MTNTSSTTEDQPSDDYPARNRSPYAEDPYRWNRKTPEPVPAEPTAADASDPTGEGENGPEEPTPVRVCPVHGVDAVFTDGVCDRCYPMMGVYGRTTTVGPSIAHGGTNTLTLNVETTTVTDDDGRTRTFVTGATRDTNTDKLEFWGFSSALVEQRYAEYMNSHRQMPDGSLRSSSNWAKGIPLDVYKHSLSRHIHDVRLHLEGYAELAQEADFETALCAALFNLNGMLYETIKARLAETSDEYDPKDEVLVCYGCLMPETNCACG